MKNTKILLIGSNGYIGNFLYKKLESSYDFSCVDSCWFDESKNNCIKSLFPFFAPS